MLTESQKKVYDYLKSRAQGGLPPTVREICKATGLKSTSSVHAPEDTEREGYISRDAGLNRAIHLVGSSPLYRCRSVGRVAAGQPILAVEEVEGYVPFCPPNQNADDYFALRVRGESMKWRRHPGRGPCDCPQVSTAEDGEMVVALIDDEATVKYLYREPDRIRLQPDNPEYEPIYATDVTVIGKVVVASIRYYK